MPQLLVMWQQSLRYYGPIRNPRVSFRGHTDSIQVDETFVEIHAEDDDEPATSLTRPGLDMDPTNMDLLLDMDGNTWASQGFERLSRRPFSQQARPTNREQNRGSCFF